VFSALAIDIDTGNHTLDAVAAAVAAVTGGARAEIYSSSSAKEHDRKWRVLVPLATMLPGADYADTQTALFELLAERGLGADVALARPGQPVYLPNVPPKYRGPDGRPAFYQSRHVAGARLALVAECAIVTARDGVRERKAAEEAAARQKAEEYKNKRLAHVAATGDDFEPIAHFNANHSVAAMFARYGFQCQPNRPNHYRHPESEKGSYATEDFGDHWVCLSEWANTLNVGRPTKKNFRSGDAFDLFTHFEHGGDRRAAARAYAQAVRPAATVALVATTPAEPPPVRVETFPTAPMVTVDELRASITTQIAGIVATRPALAVLTPGTSAGKTYAATRDIPAAFDRVVFNIDSHDNSAAVVEECKRNGFDAGAIPPVNESTCAAWTDDDARRLAAHYGKRPGLSMQRAMAVGMSPLACFGCPLRPDNKTPTPPLENELAFLEESGWDVSKLPAAETSCRYWQQRREAESKPVVAQCQERTRRNPGAIAPHVGEKVAVVTDENALGVLAPHVLIDVDAIRAVGDVIRAAAGNLANKLTKTKIPDVKGQVTPPPDRHAMRIRELLKKQPLARPNRGTSGDIQPQLAGLCPADSSTLRRGKKAKRLPSVNAARKRKLNERERKRRLVDWGMAVADVADALAWVVENLAENGDTGLHELTLPEVAAERLFAVVECDDVEAAEAFRVVRIAAPHMELANLIARSELPTAFNRDAFELVRLVATGKRHDAHVYVSLLPNGERAAHVHRTYSLELPPGVVHIVLDATAPLPALRQIRPDAVFLEPPGKAPFHHFAAQWWREIRPDSHPAVVLDTIERILEYTGWTAAALQLCKRHRRVLFPQTRPRHGVPMDRPVDVDAIANWNAGKRHLRDADYPRRRRDAEALAARVDAIRGRLARDANGNARVEHMRGTVSRGSNTFMADSGIDGLAVVGFTRCNPSAIVGHLLATGQADAVTETDGKWTPLGIAGTLPTVTGGTRDVRWSGYADQRWADAAAAVNRADLVQTWSRGRPQLATGVPVLVAAAEPCGLPLLDIPERAPDGVRAVVAVVERLAAECEARQVSGVVEPGQKHPVGPEPERVNAVVAMGSIGHACIGHTEFPISYTRMADRNARPVGVAMDDIRQAMREPERSVRRWLADAVERGLLARSGTGRWTRYALPNFCQISDKSSANLEVARPAESVRQNVGTLSQAGTRCLRGLDNIKTVATVAGGAKSHDVTLPADALPADVACTTTAANAAHGQHLDDDTATASRLDIVSTLHFDTANAAFLEAAAELDDAWEPWVDDTVAAAATRSSAQNEHLKRHQPTNVWRVVSSEPHRHRSPVASATTPTTHGQRGGHARPPPRRVDAGTGG
jgi:hypothetical protein